uniref:Retrotransposon protein n=1 Tax=Cannabis sativa TaxID=3483 RepID=A0A803P0T1_CANSA
MDATKVTSSRKIVGYCIMNEMEMKEKKYRGVCFMCDQKWHHGHECKADELQIILIQAEPESREENPIEEGLGIFPSPTTEALIEIFLNSAVGLTSPKTMKLLGSIQD